MEGMSQGIPADSRRCYENITRDSRYQHFVRIGPRIVRCLDYHRIEFDRTLVGERLLAYYLFIGVVDEALDSGNLNIGNRILEHFDRTACQFHEDADSSNVELVTEVLKRYVRTENRALFSSRLADLYREVLREQATTSIDAYIEHRKVIGTRTAELSYILIQDLLQGNTDAVCRLMTQVGKVGCLVDSVIDLKLDRRLGLLRFRPSASDRLKLIAYALREGALAVFQYPSLTTVFLEAIADNVRDRFRTRPPESALSQQKEEVAGVV